MYYTVSHLIWVVLEAELSYIVVAGWRYNYASARRRKIVIRGLLTDERGWVQSE